MEREREEESRKGGLKKSFGDQVDDVYRSIHDKE